MNRKKIILYSLIILFGFGFAYAWNYYKKLSSPAHPTAFKVLQSEDEVIVKKTRWITFTPKDDKAETALVFYPGGLLEIEGYSEPFLEITRHGYVVVLVTMPLNLAVLAPGRAKDVIEHMPKIKHWVIGGHSLGGAMAAQFAFENKNMVDGLLLFDAYPPEGIDLKSFPAPVGLIHRADQDGKMPEYYKENIRNLPDSLMLFPLQGGVHINFGRFIPASRFQSQEPPTLTIDDQFEKIVAATCTFLSRVENQ